MEHCTWTKVKTTGDYNKQFACLPDRGRFTFHTHLRRHCAGLKDRRQCEQSQSCRWGGCHAHDDATDAFKDRCSETSGEKANCQKLHSLSCQWSELCVPRGPVDFANVSGCLSQTLTSTSHQGLPAGTVAVLMLVVIVLISSSAYVVHKWRVRKLYAKFESSSAASGPSASQMGHPSTSEHPTSLAM
jgi:hypothetical protein